MKILGVAHTKNRQFFITFVLRELKLGVAHATPGTNVGPSLAASTRKKRDGGPFYGARENGCYVESDCYHYVIKWLTKNLHKQPKAV